MNAVLASIPCGPGLECASGIGVLTVVMAFVIFVGSVYLILASVFGRRMGYLVLAVAFFGYMILQSSLWLFGFWSQGLDTPTNLGPRGAEPHWAALGVGVEVASPRYPVVDGYPGEPWQVTDDQEASVGTVTTAIQEFMAEQANDQLAESGSGERVSPSDFSVTNVRFASSGGTSLAAGEAVFAGGGPKVTVFAYHDSGDVPKYSVIFLVLSVIGFAVHLPFLDRAERKRKAVLTGGKAPEWRGPA
jgi:hypothetical protein